MPGPAPTLPAAIIPPAAAASGLFAVFTYALFAEDVNFVLANAWSFAVAGVNPYLVAPNAVPGNPYRPFTGWGDLAYLYGPAWLAVGVATLRATNAGVLAYVLVTKGLLLGTLWLIGGLAWKLARMRGSAKPVASAALILWNPLLLVDGVMTPHPDLPMAAALLAALLAWSAKREAAAVLLFALSIAVKLFTALLIPAALLSMALAGAFHGPRRHPLARAVAATGLIFAALWPGVWDPFLRSGLQQELRLNTNTALIPNVIAGLGSTGLLPRVSEVSAALTAESWRWFLFVPFWALCTALCALLASRRPRDLPMVLFEPLALLLVGYHVLFAQVVLPWHFTTAICLCLAAGSGRGLLAGALMTASGLLYYVNAQWVWTHTWQHTAWVGWILSLSLLGGPIVGLTLLLQELSSRCRVSSPTAPTGVGARRSPLARPTASSPFAPTRRVLAPIGAIADPRDGHGP